MKEVRVCSSHMLHAENKRKNHHRYYIHSDNLPAVMSEHVAASTGKETSLLNYASKHKQKSLKNNHF